MSIKLDLHIHSESRGKIFINPQQLILALRARQLDGVAITNFFDISHAKWLKEKLKDYIIIVGQEIWTKDGHILGLGLKERISDFQSAQETIAQIHSQGGIAVAAHPYLHLGLGNKVMSLPIDAIESYNALTGTLLVPNYLAKRSAEKRNLAQTAGSDTTDARFIGRGYTQIMVDEPRFALEAIMQGKTRLYKKPLPIPFIFILRVLLLLRNTEPCLLHAVPCIVCGQAMTIRLWRKKFQCVFCAKTTLARFACCNGHYICKECVIKKTQETLLLILGQDTLCYKKNT